MFFPCGRFCSGVWLIALGAVYIFIGICSHGNKERFVCSENFTDYVSHGSRTKEEHNGPDKRYSAVSYWLEEGYGVFVVDSGSGLLLFGI